MGETHIKYSMDDEDGNEVVVDAYAYYTPFQPATYHSPAEGGLEDIRVEKDGVDITDTLSKHTLECIEAALVEEEEYRSQPDPDAEYEKWQERQWDREDDYE